MTANTRLVSLDAYRGMTIAAMILVNNPGSWGSVYAPLRHAEWHGATPTDWIFPFFLFIVGAVLLALGLAWDTVFPINKQLWTSSYVLYTSGIAMLLLGVVYWWIDIKGRTWGTRPFVVYGMNALVVFTLSGLIARTLNITGVQSWFWQSVFQPAFASSLNASLAHAIAHVLLLLGIAWILYARRIFIKV